VVSNAYANAVKIQGPKMFNSHRWIAMFKAGKITEGTQLSFKEAGITDLMDLKNATDTLSKTDLDWDQKGQAFMFKSSMDKEQAKQFLELDESLNEATDMNDPVLMAFRAAKAELPNYKPKDAKIRKLSFDKYMDLLDDQSYVEQVIKDKAEEMAQTFRDMEQEAEPEGGEIADEYGSTMMKQETEYAKLKAKKDKIMARIDKHRMA